MHRRGTPHDGVGEKYGQVGGAYGRIPQGLRLGAYGYGHAPHGGMLGMIHIAGWATPLTIGGRCDTIMKLVAAMGRGHAGSRARVL